MVCERFVSVQWKSESVSSSHLFRFSLSPRHNSWFGSQQQCNSVQLRAIVSLWDPLVVKFKLQLDFVNISKEVKCPSNQISLLKSNQHNDSTKIRLFFANPTFLWFGRLSLSQLCLFSGQGNGLFAESSAHKADIS